MGVWLLRLRLVGLSCRLLRLIGLSGAILVLGV